MSQSGLKVLVTSSASDSHTWNLIFLQLFLEEMGNEVVNLGPCVPEDLLAEECRAHTPDLVVISSVNGHGYRDGLRAISRLRREPELAAVPVVIGGKLGLAGERDADGVRRLRAAGFAAVFNDGDLDAFRQFVSGLTAETPAPVRPGRSVA
jgi:methylaspartate mutase sigma subunit